MTILEGYLSEPELAGQLGKTPRTLQRWRRLRVGPPVTYVGRAPLYRVESIERWLRQRETPMVREVGQ